jgi:hypothetical protein
MNHRIPVMTTPLDCAYRGARKEANDGGDWSFVTFRRGHKLSGTCTNGFIREGDSMYRNRWHFYPKTFADWAKVVAIAREYGRLAAAKGWAEGTFWSQTVGETPAEIIGEWDYPDLAAFQQEVAEYDCPEMEKIFGGLDELEVTRPICQELLEAVPLD